MGTPCHTALIDSLHAEQQGLCCYCESAVADTNGHIEHMAPRSRNPARTYDYENLALSCDGGTVEHCGRYKDDRKKNLDHAWDAARFSLPHDPATASLFQYSLLGGIAATSFDAAKATYLIGYLGLDCARLKERRKQHARNLTDVLRDATDTDIVDLLRQDYLEPNADGRLKPFHSLSKAILEP